MKKNLAKRLVLTLTLAFAYVMRYARWQDDSP